MSSGALTHLAPHACQPALAAPWHEALRSGTSPYAAWRSIPRSGPLRVLPHVWKWAEIEPYLHLCAEIAPLEFTERQRFC